MTRTITAHEATVKTATVEVKTLTISGKQVTLSVFRQIKDEDLVDPMTGKLRGVPWGIVNYFWGDCAKAEPHLHVVWQKGGELRRACCWPSCDWTGGYFELCNTAQQIARGWLEFKCLTSPEECQRLSKHAEYTDGGSFRYQVRMSDLPFNFTLDGWVADALRYWQRYGEDYAARQWEAARAKGLPEWLERWAYGTPEEMWVDVVRAFDARDEFSRKWREQYAQLADLDHLFIAV